MVRPMQAFIYEAERLPGFSHHFSAESPSGYYFSHFLSVFCGVDRFKCLIFKLISNTMLILAFLIKGLKKDSTQPV